jgi:transcriptional regulator with XRE-family HTH domain
MLGFMKEEVEDIYAKALGQAIRELRKEAGFSQEGFADAVGLHRTYMGSIERGKQNLTIRNIVRVAQTLKMKPSELLVKMEAFLES